MRLTQFAVMLVSGAVSWAFFAPHALAEDVTVNLDALGPSEPPKKIAPPKPAAKPKPPAAPVAEMNGEFDFISKTKSASGQPGKRAAPASQPVQPMVPVSARPAPAPRAPSLAMKPSPVMSQPVPDDPAPPTPSQNMAPQGAPPPPEPAPFQITPVAAPLPAAPPKPKPAPATVQVNSGALDSVATAPAAAPKGTPLTSIAPNGVLFIPKNVDALPAPVAVPQSAPQAEEANRPLTLPPPVPEAAAPGLVQTAAASAPPVARPQSERTSVLTGFATAGAVQFNEGGDELTDDARASLDQLAPALKAANLRVQLVAYSGPPNNKSSEDRRLSLKRALTVRQHLAAQGVPASMVNLVAFGGAPEGPTDRVDLMVRQDQISKIARQ